MAREVIGEVRVQALDANTGAAHSPARLDSVTSQRGHVASASVVVVGAFEVLGLNESLEAVHPAGAFDATDGLVQFGINQPVQRGHRGAVAQVRLVLDHDRTPVTASHDHRAATREGAAHQCFNDGEVLRGRVAKGQRQNSRVPTKRDTKPCRPDGALLEVVVDPVEDVGTIPDVGFTSGWKPGSVEFWAT